MEKQTVQEKVNKARLLAKLIAKLPDKDEALLIAMMNAYIDGMTAGRKAAGKTFP